MIYDPHNYRFARSMRELNRDPYDWFENDPGVEQRRQTRKAKIAGIVAAIVLAAINILYYCYA